MAHRQEKALHPMHESMMQRIQQMRGASIRPVGMARIFIDSDTRKCIEGIALSIYTDMVNAGATLQETLAAVYLSGSENALMARKGEKDD
jgi:hypothetical protein